jgi:hypothetical protein
MLIYIRRTEADLLMEPIRTDSIPRHLRDFYAAEKEERKSKRVVGSLVKVFFVHESVLRTNAVNNVGGFWPDSVPLWQAFPDAMPCHELYNQIAAACNVAHLRVWRLDSSRIPSSVLPDDDTPLAAVSGAVLWLFVQTRQDDEDLQMGRSVMVYAKFFFPAEKAPLQYIGSFAVGPSDTFGLMCRIVCGRFGLPESTTLEIYHESHGRLTKYSLADSCASKFLAARSLLLIFQFPARGRPWSGPINFEMEPSPEASADGGADESGVPRHEVVIENKRDAAAYLSNLVRLEVEVFHLEQPNKPLFILSMPQAFEFAALKPIIAQHAGVEYGPNDAMTLAKAVPSSDGGLAYTVIDIKLYKIPQYILSASSAPDRWRMHKLFFRVFHGIPERLIDTMSMARVQVSMDAKTIEFKVNVITPKSGACCDLVRAINDSHPLGAGPFRALSIWEHEIQTVFLESDDYTLSLTQTYLRIEKIPRDQIDWKGPVITAAYYCTTGGIGCDAGLQAIGQPFLLPVIKGELFNKTKERLLTLMELPKPEAINEFEFRVGSKWNVKDRVRLADDDVLSDHITYYAKFFVVRTAAFVPATPAKSRREPSIRIYN